MSHFGVRLGAVLACGVGAWLMASSLFGHAWWQGAQGRLEVRGGVINALICSSPDDPDPLPMGVGEHDGCTSRSYPQLGAAPSHWFVGPMHMALMGGAGAVGLFALFVAALALAFEIDVVPRRQKLSFTFFDIDSGVVEVHQHPGRQGAYLAVLGLVALGIASLSAPEGLSAGPDLWTFVGGTLLALAAGFVADPRVLLSAEAALRVSGAAEAGAASAAGAVEPAAEAARGETGEALPEAEVEADDSPRCRRCGKQTAWLEKAGRHRCLACGLYQPLHPPGSQVDAP